MQKVLKDFHSGTRGGHLRVKKTLERLKQSFYWVGCHQAVKDWITNCTQCIADKDQMRGGRGQLQQLGRFFEEDSDDRKDGGFP